MARLGVPVGGRVKKLRAVGDQSGPIPGRENEQAWTEGKGAIWSIPRARCPRTLYRSYCSIAGGARSMRAMTG